MNYKSSLMLVFKSTALLVIAFFVSAVVCPIAATAANNQLNFNVAPRHQIGLNTSDITYADLDGDGFLDFAVVNGGQENPSPTVTMRFGAGDGNFSAPLVLPSYLIGQTLAAGDLNNDGKPDLVVGSWYHNALAVFLNQGNRQFAAPVFTIPPDPPYPGGAQIGEFFDLAIADFDGDGNNEVVALQDQVNQRLRFFRFNAQGTLTVFATLNQIGNDTSYEAEIAVGDFNADNRADLVFANGGPFGLRTLCFVFGQPPGGNLSLTYGFQVDDKAVGISVKDLDNDGDRDMAVAFLDVTTPTRHSLQVFRNNGSGGFTAVPKIFLEYPFPPDDITTGDFNNDGKQDIAALLGSVYDGGIMVMVTYGNGDGTYAGEKYYAVSSSSSIFAADLNQDNRLDLLTASSFLLQTDYSDYVGLSNNTLNVLFNDNLQKFKAPLVTLWGPNFIDAGDFNNDGYTDLVSSWATLFNSTSGVDILLNNTAEGLLPEVHHPSPAALNGMKTGDFNGDGKWDAVSAHEDNSRVLALYLGNGTGTLAPPVTMQFSNGLLTITVGDFNSDGRDDVFALDDAGGGYSALGNSNGTFSLAPGSPMPFPNNGVIIPQTGDFNGDHRLDLIVSRNAEVKLWLGDGTGRFTQSPVEIPPMSHAVPGDFNGDGKLDVAGVAGSGIIGVLGNGSGGFAGTFTKTIEGTYTILLTQSVVSADFDLDGYDDVALTMTSNTFGNLIVIPSGGAGAPSWKNPIFYGVGTASGMLVAADFNADGKPDLGYRGANARGVIYNTTVAPRRPPFDFDGDGKADFSVFRPSNGYWYINNSSNNALVATQFGSAGDLIAPADFDGDGKTDVCVFRPSDGGWYRLNSSNNTFIAAQFGTNGDLPVPGDFDGDRKADIAVYRPSAGSWYRINSSNNQFIAAQFGIAEDKPIVGDFDGDGKSDLTVFRPSNGTWYRINSATDSFSPAQFGISEDLPVAADYDGDGKTDIAVYRPSVGDWYIVNSSNLSFTGLHFGVSEDKPAPADFDGDGKADFVVFRPSNGTWYLLRTTAGFTGAQFGTNGDIPAPNAFVR